MKTQSKKEILGLFDYAKIAFALNKNHRAFYKPQIIYFALRGLLITLTLYALLQSIFPAIHVGADIEKTFSMIWHNFLGTPLLALIATILISWLGSIYLEAGLFTLYNKAYDEGSLDVADFYQGANQYFLSFLLGELLIALLWIVALLPFVIVGLFTLFLGFIWIPILASAFLMTWKIALISDDVGLIQAFKNSLSFTRSHLSAMVFYTVIMNALSGNFSAGGSGGGNVSGNMGGNFNTDLGSDLPFDGSHDFGTSLVPQGQFLDLFKNILYVAATLVGIITIFVSMIQMILKVYFGLLTVVIYKDGFDSFNLEKDTEEVTIHETV